MKEETKDLPPKKIPREIEVWNYREIKCVGSEPIETLALRMVRLKLWETRYDIPSECILRRYRTPRTHEYQRTINLTHTTDHVLEHSYTLTFKNETNIDGTLRGLFDNYIETKEPMLLGLIGERLEELDYSTLGTLLLRWYQVSQERLIRPLVKSHNLMVYLPCNPADMDLIRSTNDGEIPKKPRRTYPIHPNDLGRHGRYI